MDKNSSRVFIIGTGPSLAKIDHNLLELLAHESTIGVNWVGRTHLPFICSSLVVILGEWLWYERSKFNRPGIFVNALKGAWGRLPETCWYGHEERVEELDSLGWNYLYYTESTPETMDRGYFYGLNLDGVGITYAAPGQSVTSVAVQIACSLGYKEIYLLGCDASTGGHAYAENPRLDLREDQSWYKASMRVGEELMKRKGVRLVDLTEGGELPVTKGSLKEVLEKGTAVNTIPAPDIKPYIEWSRPKPKARIKLGDGRVVRVLGPYQKGNDWYVGWDDVDGSPIRRLAKDVEFIESESTFKHPLEG